MNINMFTFVKNERKCIKNDSHSITVFTKLIRYIIIMKLRANHVSLGGAKFEFSAFGDSEILDRTRWQGLLSSDLRGRSNILNMLSDNIFKIREYHEKWERTALVTANGMIAVN
jgi:hypothetical protein